jgi:hypothetical protein
MADGVFGTVRAIDLGVRATGVWPNPEISASVWRQPVEALRAVGDSSVEVPEAGSAVAFNTWVQHNLEAIYEFFFRLIHHMP